MLNRISRVAIVIVFLAALMAVGGTATPVHASHGSEHVEEIVHSADIDHIVAQIHEALSHPAGLTLRDADLVYNALGRTNTAIDLLYDSAASGDVFNAAEHLLVIQRDLLQEVERATLSGNIADLSTVTPLLVEYAQARIAFERQAAINDHGIDHDRDFLHDGDILHDRGFLRDRSLFDRDRFFHDRDFLHDDDFHGRSLFDRRRFVPDRRFSTPRHRTHPFGSLSSLYLQQRRGEVFDRFHHDNFR